MQEKGTGKRFNDGKDRYDLLPSNALTSLAKVMQAGASKYGEWNWQKGMEWHKCYASLLRHINKFWQGEDFDEETGELHIAHAAINAIFLLEYYRLYPEGDNRPSAFHRERKVGLDVDGVLADFSPAYLQKAEELNMLKFPQDKMHHWETLYNDEHLWKDICSSKDFWLNLNCIERQQDLTFHPNAYVTSRSIPKEWTEEWLMKHNYPAAPVHTIPRNANKVQTLKDIGIDLFVDDKFENYLQINKAGIFCLLYSQPHNAKYNVGFRRINSLKEVEKWLK